MKLQGGPENNLLVHPVLRRGKKQKRRKGLERGKRDSDEASLEMTKEQVEGR